MRPIFLQEVFETDTPRLQPMLWSMYWLNYLDRNAIALARLNDLEEDLNLKGTGTYLHDDTKPPNGHSQLTTFQSIKLACLSCSSVISWARFLPTCSSRELAHPVIW